MTPTQVVWHDLLHREIKSAVRGFDGAFIATLSEYDRMGTLAKKSAPFFLTSASSAAPFASSFSYDRAGRMTSKTAPDGEIAIGQTPPAGRYVTTSYNYAGNRTAVQVRNSRGVCVPANVCVDVVRYSGVLGLMRTDDALSGVTRYWADAAGRPVAIADAKTNAQYPGAIPSGKVTHATYNKLGHRTNATDPNQGSWNFVYNGAGELVQQTDARAIGTTIVRDTAGRPTVQKTWIPAWEGSPAEHYRDEWTYRSDDGLLGEVRRCVASSLPAECTLNQPPVVGNTVWRETYDYDYGRVDEVNAMQRVGAQELTFLTRYHYDGNYGREKAVEYASGLKVQRIFTKFGALRDVIDADTGERFWGVGGLDAFGNVTRQDYGNGVYGEYSYDPLSGRAVRKQWSRLVNGVPQVVDSVDYGYDVLANVAAQRRVVPGVVAATETYTYDELQRLAGSSVSGSGYSVGYDYDALGNLTRKNDYSRDVANAYRYDNANSCGPNVATTILMPTGGAYDRIVNSCDPNGNVILTQPANADGQAQGSPRKIRYDATNRPRNIMDQGAPSAPSAMFTYAPDGRRVYEVLGERYFPTPGDAGVNRVRFIVQGQRGYQVELMSDANGWANATYRHEIGDVSVVLRAVPGNTGLTRDIAFKITDRLGSPLGVMDKDGQFRQRSESGYLNNADTRLTFSPFGAGRNRDFQPRTQSGEMPGRINLTPATRQGFTGHEHLDSLGLIHMNGRVYDHRLGRFLSVDPFIQFPANSQSLNPYSYIMNNPMAGMDPSGYVARRPRPENEMGPCSGFDLCYEMQASSGPVSDFRASVQSGGAPEGIWNGWEEKQAVRKVDNNVIPTVKIGELKSLVDNMKDGVMLAQEGTMTREEYEEYMGKDSPRSYSENVGETGRKVGDAGHDLIEPSWWDLLFPFLSNARKVKRANDAYHDLKDVGTATRFVDNACCCFPAGTKVWTPEGPRDIETIKVGELVYAHDPETRETSPKTVSRAVKTHLKPLYVLSIRNAHGQLSRMQATADHPFWVKGLGWTTVDTGARQDSCRLIVSHMPLCNGLSCSDCKAVVAFGVESHHADRFPVACGSTPPSRTPVASGLV